MELSTPITIHWDLPPEPADTEFLMRVSADVLACRPLMLQLRAGSVPLDSAAAAVLERFRGAPVAVTLTIPPAALDGAAALLLLNSGVKEILLAVEDAGEFERVEDIQQLFRLHQRSAIQAPALGVSFPVTRDNWRELPAVVSRCRGQGVGRLVLPMQRLYHGEQPFLINRHEQQELASALAVAGGTGEINLTIHDPFLWRAFNPGIPFPQGGCQAANTMIAIAEDGGIFPCPTLPIRLGDLREASLKAIVASPAKKELRRRLLEYPQECHGCEEVVECRGGCRGRGLVLTGSLDGIDEACR